ncbi:MAG: hypothetical protein KIS92_15650 [Planctomycetota bacterium]|nr:hypothetical protein [Planctomycetota bacterium]
MANPNVKALLGGLLSTLIGLVIAQPTIEFFAWGNPENRVFLILGLSVGIFIPAFLAMRLALAVGTKKHETSERDSN